MSRLSTKYCHYEDSLDLVHTGLYILPRHDNALVRTELLGVESRAHAHLRNHSAATRAADTCVEAWRDAQGDAVPDWLHYMSQGIDGFVADAYIELALRGENDGRALTLAERAERHTLNVRENRAPGYDRHRILDEIRFASIRLAQHDVAESVTVAQSALELAAPTSSTMVSDRLLGFHGELAARHPSDVHVIRFSEQLRDYVKRAAPDKEESIAAT